MSDLKLCYDAMEGKSKSHTLRMGYYDGDHKLSFINPKMGEVVRNGVVFRKNWCQVIVNTSRDRLKIAEWAGDTAATERIDDIWKSVLRKIVNNVHVVSLATGESYVVAWPNAAGEARAYYHDPRQTHIIYDEADPDTPRVACKRWCVGEVHYLNLYYPDRIEHYRANQKPSSYSEYRPTETPVDSNPYGKIPVFHFRPSTREMVGELSTGVLSLQDALNKLLNDMMVASEYSSFTQRWAIGNFEDGPIPVGPGTTIKLPPSADGEQPTATGTYPTTPPGNFLDPMGNLTNDMAALSGTPKHYFEGQGANVSGEALHAMEAPLIAKVELYQDQFGPTWEDLMAFCLTLSGVTADPKTIECVWKDPHTVQPESQARTRKTNTEAGIPIENILRDEGWDDDDLAQLAEDKKASQPAQPVAPPGNPQTPEQAAPKFDGIVKTPDLAGQIAASGALGRAVARGAA